MAQVLTENGAAEQPTNVDIFMRLQELLQVIAASVYTFWHWK